MLKASIEQLDAVSIVTALIACLIAAITDLRQFKVYNWVTVPYLLTGLLYNAAVCGLQGFTDSLIGALCGFGLLFFLYVFGKAGAGDVKLLAGIGAWLGAWLVFQIFLVSTIIGGILALGAIFYTKSVRATGWRLLNLLLLLVMPTRGSSEKETVQQVVQSADRRSRVVPFAAALFIGTVIVFLHNTWDKKAHKQNAGKPVSQVRVVAGNR